MEARDGRVRDEVGGFRCALGQGALLDEGANPAERGDIGACGQKLEKFAARMRRRILFHRHTIRTPLVA